MTRTRMFLPGASIAEGDRETLEAPGLEIALFLLFCSETCQHEECLCEHLKRWPLVCNPGGQSPCSTSKPWLSLSCISVPSLHSPSHQGLVTSHTPILPKPTVPEVKCLTQSCWGRNLLWCRAFQPGPGLAPHLLPKKVVNSFFTFFGQNSTNTYQSLYTVFLKNSSLS